MARAALTPYERDEQQVLNGLIREHGLAAGDYALFLVSGEGIFPSEEFEEVSGYVLHRSGQVFAFWLGWDEGRRSPRLTEWTEVSPEPHWPMVREYRQAREALGL